MNKVTKYLLLPWEDEEDEHGDAGRQNDLCFCVQLPVTARGRCPVLHHAPAPAPAPRPALLAQETPNNSGFSSPTYQDLDISFLWVAVIKKGVC